MKTTLPKRITTVYKAKKFLTNLHRNGELYHPEDDAHDIIWNTDHKYPTDEECDTLNRLMADIYQLNGFDPCDFILSNLYKDELQTVPRLPGV